MVASEIGLIVRFHDEVVYGGVSPGSDRISRAKLALRKIRSPMLWLRRLAHLFLHERF
jgi:hypothetical protein